MGEGMGEGMSFDKKLCKLIERRKLNGDTYSFRVEAPELSAIARAGQFAQIRVPEHTLRRPISICEIEGGTLRFVFQIRGEGTRKLAEMQVGENLDIIAPLGNGFPDLHEAKKILLIGGGIGVPPLLELARKYGKNTVAALGFRSGESVILEDDFSNHCERALIATDDGSKGFHGLVTHMISKERPDVVCACGPKPMLAGVVDFVRKCGAQGFISLEERMACGVGACLGCAVELQKEDGARYYGHVCKDGPVFDYRYVIM